MYRLMHRAVTVKMKKGNRIGCRQGTLWMTREGKDYILCPGDSSPVFPRGAKAVLQPLNGEAEFGVE